MFMATDVDEYFDPELGFVRTMDGEEWFAVPLKVFKVKRLEETFDSREAAGAALFKFVRSQARPIKKRDEAWPGVKNCFREHET
jgi:hypothetical protein